MQTSSLRRFGILPFVFAAACSSSGPGDPTVAGSGTGSGTVDGRSLESVEAAYLIGQPDSPDSTIVLYIFDKPLSCGDISNTGWDERVIDETMSIELKLIGKDTGDYPAASNGRPISGQSADNYTLTSTSGTPAELGATGGDVTLDSLEAGVGATGTFDLTFSAGRLSGTFDAAFCAGGNEP